MMEYLGNDTIFVGGEVRYIGDFPDLDSLPEAVAEEHDEAVLDGILLDIHPHEAARRRSLGWAGVTKALAGERLSEDGQELAVGHVAQELVAQYEQEKARLLRLKRTPDLRPLRRTMWIAIIRHYNVLSETDRHYIEQAASLTESHGQPVPPQLDRDWREKQFKD